MNVNNAFARHPFVKPLFKDIAYYVVLLNRYAKVTKVESNRTCCTLHSEVLNKSFV